MLPSATIRTAIEERLFAEGPVETPVRWTPASGGLSDASVWRVERSDTVFAVRRWWDGIDPGYVAWIAETLRAVESSGLEFIPAPIESGDAWPLRDASSGRWEAAPWKPGIPLNEIASDPAAIAAAIEGLARFHRFARGYGAGGPLKQSAFADRLQRLRSLPATLLRVATGQTAYPELWQIGPLLPVAAQRAEEMLASCGGVPPMAQPIHGDARPEHFLLRDSELTGLIDFGAMRIDTPLADLARLAGELAAGDAGCRDSLVEAYSEAASIPVDRHTVAALDLSGAVLSGANWLSWLCQPASKRRDPELVRQRLQSILARLVGG